MTDFVISADGTSIAFDRLGDGPPVVVVGGLFCDRQRTHDLAELLAKQLAGRCSVVNYDRRGRGDSTDTAPYAVEREIEDLGALIAATGGEAAVYGHSSGAGLALRAAARGLPITRPRAARAALRARRRGQHPRRPRAGHAGPHRHRGRAPRRGDRPVHGRSGGATRRRRRNAQRPEVARRRPDHALRPGRHGRRGAGRHDPRRPRPHGHGADARDRRWRQPRLLPGHGHPPRGAPPERLAHHARRPATTTPPRTSSPRSSPRTCSPAEGRRERAGASACTLAGRGGRPCAAARPVFPAGRCPACPAVVTLEPCESTTTRTTITRTTVLLSLAVALPVGAVACGDDDGGGRSTASESAYCDQRGSGPSTN